MKLERAVRDRVMPVHAPFIKIPRRHHMVDFVMAHYPLTQDGHPGYKSQHDDQRDQHRFNGQFWDVIRDWFFQPGRFFRPGCSVDYVIFHTSSGNSLHCYSEIIVFDYRSYTLPGIISPPPGWQAPIPTGRDHAGKWTAHNQPRVYRRCRHPRWCELIHPIP